MKKRLLLYHHLGLGDMIVCHGIIRECCKTHDEVTIFCKDHNYGSVFDMYSDIDNLRIVCADDNQAGNFIERNRHRYSEIKVVGFNQLNHETSFEQQFYRLAGVSLDKKWESFYIPESKQIAETFQNAGLPKRYNFIHDDTRFKINSDRIVGDRKNFHVNDIKTDSIVNYIDIMKNAQEIHAIDSSFMFLCDCLKYENKDQKLFVHRYARYNDEWLLPILKKDWEILT